MRKIARLCLWLRTCYLSNPVRLIVYLLANVGAVFLGASFLVFSGRLIDQVVAMFQDGVDADPYALLAQMIGIGVLTAAFRFISAVAEKRLTDDLERHLSERFFNVVQGADFLLFERQSFQEKMKAARMVTSGAVMWMVMHFSQILSLAAAVIAYLSILRTTSFSAMIMAGLSCLAMSVFGSMKRFKTRHQARLALIERERKLSYIEDLVFSSQVAKEIHTFNLFSALKNEWDFRFGEIQSEQISMARKDIDANLVLNSFPVLLTMMLLASSFYLGHIDSPGKFTVVLAAFTVLMGSIKDVGKAVSDFYEASVHLELLGDFEKLGENSEITFSESSGEGIHENIIELSDVSFTYDNGKTYSLTGIDLAVKKGKVVAVVGENGAGKSTLANIVLGLYRPEKGSIRVRGEDPYHSGCNDPKVISISQTFGRYFGLTLKENVAFGLDGGRLSLDDDLAALFNKVGLDCHDVLDLVVGNQFDGIDLSGGQWQRIAILRSFIDSAEIVIFDEPTAALDPLSEIEVFDALMNTHKGKTIILITHRLGVARRADEIVVLHDGEIVESGSHESLMAQEGRYREMFDSQAQWYSGTQGGDLLAQHG
ncbi:MAG: ABC transporter ATP-binding protein [Limnochordia bacterium]|nr:ABC transporter ATP-binding protein/permease [Limnochordia bacterium]MDD2629888.1 ABC transporter ATP-binding protein [Limnochordia bacterium]MDD4518043.1 ABC transporter ATP-binding protein [Limnochordia bacterium]